MDSSIPPKPKYNSLNTEINRMKKTFVESLVTDDYKTDNAVQFNGKFSSGKTTVKVNSLLKTSHKEGVNTFNICDDAQIDTHLGKNLVQLKLKGNKITFTHDFDNYYKFFKFSSKNFDTWWKTYFQLSTDRSFNNKTLSLGLFSKFNNYLEHNKLNISRNDNKVDIEGEWNAKYQCCNFLL